MTPPVGARYRHDSQLGLALRLVGDDMSPDMRALDMPPGAEVTVLDHDADRDLVLVEWVDAHGNPRITSIEPSVFAEHFTEVTG
jgi:hypothetical protein